MAAFRRDLQASRVIQAAISAATAFGAFRIHLHVTDFARRATRAAIRFTVQNHGAADSCSHKNADNVVISLAPSQN